MKSKLARSTFTLPGTIRVKGRIKWNQRKNKLYYLRPCKEFIDLIVSWTTLSHNWIWISQQFLCLILKCFRMWNMALRGDVWYKKTDLKISRNCPLKWWSYFVSFRPTVLAKFRRKINIWPDSFWRDFAKINLYFALTVHHSVSVKYFVLGKTYIHLRASFL